MSGKRRHQERLDRVKARVSREKRAAEARGHAVDFAALAPQCSYSGAEFAERGYYIDVPFECKSCGMPQVWTAAQQKWWYEVAKGSVFSTAKLCRPCRQRKRAQKKEPRVEGGDPNRYKSAGQLFAKVRSDLEPELLAAGFVLVGRSHRHARRMLFLDYGRPGEMLTISWDQHYCVLSAERLSDGASDLLSIANVVFAGAGSTSEIEERLAGFENSVRSFLVALPVADRGSTLVLTVLRGNALLDAPRRSRPDEMRTQRVPDGIPTEDRGNEALI
jgi:Probable zinc-ribbon domain